jgi:hypothetical protein
MSLDLSKAAGVVLAALVSAVVWLFIWGVPVAAAGRSPIFQYERFQRAPASATDVIVSVVLVAGLVAAGVAFSVLSSRHERGESRAQVRTLAIRHEHEQKRKAA